MENFKIADSSLDTILCKVETDNIFLEEIRQIADKKDSANNSFFQEKDQYFLDNEMLEEINQKAIWHTQSNMVNRNNIDMNHQDKGQSLNCQCGCKKQKGQLLSIFTAEERIASLGSGIILVFFYLKHLRLLLAISAMTFGLFCFVSNFCKQHGPYPNCSEREGVSLAYCEFNEASSFRSVYIFDFLIAYQYAIGFFMIVVWVLGIKIILYLGTIKNKESNNLMGSSADSTIMISNLPIGEFEEKQLRDYLKNIWVQNECHESCDDIPRIKSIQIIYDMQSCRIKIAELTSLAIEMVGYLQKKRFKTSNQIKEDKIYDYRRAKKKFLQKLQELYKMREQFLEDPEFRKKISTSMAIVEFWNKDYQIEFLDVLESAENPIQNALLPKHHLQFKDTMPVISRSPQPSDILWLNCQKKQSYFRTVIIWIITIIILYLGYALVSYIQTLQVLKKLDHVVSTIVLQLLNRLIWFWLSIVVTYELNYTKTDSIISSMKKSIIAQTINIIVNPILAVFVNQKSLYGVNGLSGMALTYQIVMLGMMFLYNIFNPFFIGKKIILNVRCFRNLLIKHNTKIKSHIYTYDEIRPVLDFYEGPEFPIAGSYVYMTSALFHAMFYSHLQPAILLLLFLNMTVFLFIMKYMLFKRCKFPELTNEQIFRIAMFTANCAAAYYGVGSIFFYLIDSSNENLHYAQIIPSVLCLVVWFLSNLELGGFWKNLAKAIVAEVNKYSRSKNKTRNEKIERHNLAVIQALESYSVTIDSRQLYCRRRQSYYTNANTNTLLEFEYVLKKVKGDNFLRGKELKKFCEGFCDKEKTVCLSRFSHEIEGNEFQRSFSIPVEFNERKPDKEEEESTYIPAIRIREPKQKSVRFHEKTKVFIDHVISEGERISME